MTGKQWVMCIVAVLVAAGAGAGLVYCGAALYVMNYTGS